MYMIYTANIDGNEIEQGHYVGIAQGHIEARQIVETKGDLCDGLYDCFMLTSGRSIWLLKQNKGEWDYFFESGEPLVISEEDLTIPWSSFTCDAEKERLQNAKRIARNGSYQAIYDAYQALDAPNQRYDSGCESYGVELAGLGFGISDLGSDDYDFGLGSFDLGSGYSGYSELF